MYTRSKFDFFWLMLCAVAVWIVIVMLFFVGVNVVS